jgi:sulfhydrogenase subunit beta (sulfur reductase)
VVYDEIASVADLPAGWTDEQDGGTYQLHGRADEALFGYALGPHSWKRYLFPPHTMLWQASRSEDGLTMEAGHEDPPGTRSSACRGCELAAMRPGQGLP